MPVAQTSASRAHTQNSRGSAQRAHGRAKAMTSPRRSESRHSASVGFQRAEPPGRACPSDHRPNRRAGQQHHSPLRRPLRPASTDGHRGLPHAPGGTFPRHRPTPVTPTTTPAPPTPTTSLSTAASRCASPPRPGRHACRQLDTRQGPRCRPRGPDPSPLALHPAPLTAGDQSVGRMPRGAPVRRA